MKINNPLIMEIQPVLNKIYEIRGYKVMLDFDLAEVYQVPTKVLNQAVKRNIERFPHDFMFQLTKEEFSNLRSQVVTSSWGGIRYPPYAFTEHGVVMLSSVLRSEIAVKASILTVRAFVAVRQLVLNARPTDRMAELERQMHELKRYIEESFADYNDINEDTRMQLELISEALAELQAQKRIAEKPRRPIGFRRNNVPEN